MPSARRAGVPPDVIKEWEADFRKKKAEQQKKGGRKLPSGSVQYTHNGVTYTAKWGGGTTRSGIKSVSFPEAAYEARIEGQRSRRGEQQKIRLSSIEQMMVDNKYQDADLLTRESGQRHVVDHKVPVAAGGFSNAPWNLDVLTDPTNLKKSDTVGGEIGRIAAAEAAHNAEIAIQLRQLKATRGAIGFNPIITKTEMPPLGGFQEGGENLPQTTAGTTQYKPETLGGFDTTAAPQIEQERLETDDSLQQPPIQRFADQMMGIATEANTIKMYHQAGKVFIQRVVPAAVSTGAAIFQTAGALLTGDGL